MTVNSLRGSRTAGAQQKAGPLRLRDFSSAPCPTRIMCSVSAIGGELRVRFALSKQAPTQASPIWGANSWRWQFVHLAPRARFDIPHRNPHPIIICGSISNFGRPRFAPARAARTAAFSGKVLEAGPNGATIAIFYEHQPPVPVTDMKQVSLDGPEITHLKGWTPCGDYWPSFRGTEFWNLRGWRIDVEREGMPDRKVCFVQFWTAGVGVNCGMHDHSDLTGDAAFCEIHLCLANGTGKGGMVGLVNDVTERAVPLQPGEEHGPFWDIANNGAPARRADGSVVYKPHRWQAGEGARQGYDFWAAIELLPEEASVDL